MNLRTNSQTSFFLGADFRTEAESEIIDVVFDKVYLLYNMCTAC